MRIRSTLAATVSLLIAISTMPGWAAEAQPAAPKHGMQRVEAADVPAIPKDTLGKLTDHFAVIAYEKGTTKGKTVYGAEVTGKAQGTLVEYIVNEQGSFLRKRVIRPDAKGKQTGAKKPDKKQAKSSRLKAAGKSSDTPRK